MNSEVAAKALESAVEVGRAIVKFIAPNDTKRTGAHQSGFYLPKDAWRLYSPHPPVIGRLEKHPVSITWDGELATESAVTWYGRGTRREYRLTRFGRGFPYLDPIRVGSLLVLVPRRLDAFEAFVIDDGSDAEELITSLGLEPWRGWAVYESGAVEIPFDDCVAGIFHRIAAEQIDWPSSAFMATTTWNTLIECDRAFLGRSVDEQLVEAMHREYALYRMVEEHLALPLLSRTFATVDDYLMPAQGLLQRRKSRAGRSFENHIATVLSQSGIPFEAQPADVDGRPDFVIPSASAYHDSAFPVGALFVVGAKTTCKDRWRQVVQEGKRIRSKHLLTLQPSISEQQAREMGEAGVTLVVPRSLQSAYEGLSSPPLTVNGFVETVNATLRTHGLMN